MRLAYFWTQVYLVVICICYTRYTIWEDPIFQRHRSFYRPFSDRPRLTIWKQTDFQKNRDFGQRSLCIVWPIKQNKIRTSIQIAVFLCIS